MSGLKIRPLAVAVQVEDDWYDYKSGLIDNKYCGEELNHAVLLVGIENGVWKIQNSWGTTWGYNGYGYLTPGNTCGITTYGAQPY